MSYADRVEDYQQVAAIARAEDIAVLNAGYAYDRLLLDRLGAAHAGAGVARGWSPSTSPTGSPPRPRRRRPRFAPLLDVARSVLGRARAVPVVRSLPPASRCRPCCSSAATPTASATGSRWPRRPCGPWADALDTLATPDAVPRFVLNADNPAVRRLADAGDAALQRVAVEALYSHALLAGRHPLTPFDSALVARALPALIDRAIDGGTA